MAYSSFFAYWLTMSAVSPQARMINARPELVPNPARPHQPQKALAIQPLSPTANSPSF